MSPAVECELKPRSMASRCRPDLRGTTRWAKAPHLASTRLFFTAAATVVLFLPEVQGQAPLPIYTDQLVSGFQDWGWAPRNYANPAPVHSGNDSVSVTISSAWEGVQIVHAAFDSRPYSSVTFWINGGSGGQQLQVCGLAQIGSTQNVWQTCFLLPALQTNWQPVTIPLSTLGIADKANATGIAIQDRLGAAQPTFYLDDIQFDPKPAPALVHVSLNATQTLGTVDARHFGVNFTMWDGNYDPTNDATTASLLQEMGCLTARMPGGSLSDEYHWSWNTTFNNGWTWAASFADMLRVATNVGMQTFITVNYGTGSTNEAAAWVAYANGWATNTQPLGTDQFGTDWGTVGYWAALRGSSPLAIDDGRNFLRISRSTPLGFKNWEIGNECYGTWETDSNAVPHDPFTYASRARDYIRLMKAADPTIKIGVVAAPGEDSYLNNSNHFALNPRTGQTHYGWTPVLLATLHNLNVTPDFLIHHVYPEWTDKNNPGASPDNDTTLLLSTGNWAVDAADLRQQIADYFGPEGSNIELAVTENNSDAGAQGRQSTSLVNGVYYADGLGQLLRTEFKSFIWWDLRNSTDTNGYFGPNVYGWRNYGDLGVINGLNTRHPTFYAAKLMHWFGRPGDKVLNPSTDYVWLTAHGVRQSNGAVALLVLNKSLITNLNAQISITGFVPNSVATLRSYGIPQDEAARTNGPAAAQDIATNTLTGMASSFSYTFSPLSMTLFSLAPAPPMLTIVSPSPAIGLVLQLTGQPNIPYVLQSSADLRGWIPISTNVLAGSMLNFTNPINSGQQFWRAVWEP